MEDIYRWFLMYMQFATQGRDGAGDVDAGTAYNEKAVSLHYWERGWNFEIQPTALPGLRYGRDVVVPTWTLQAATVDEDPGADAAIELGNLVRDGIAKHGTDFTLTGEIGYNAENPFSDPFPKLS